jgi:hypothetical protein
MYECAWDWEKAREREYRESTQYFFGYSDLYHWLHSKPRLIASAPLIRSSMFNCRNKEARFISVRRTFVPKVRRTRLYDESSSNKLPSGYHICGCYFSYVSPFTVLFVSHSPLIVERPISISTKTVLLSDVVSSDPEGTGGNVMSIQPGPSGRRFTIYLLRIRILYLFVHILTTFEY